MQLKLVLLISGLKKVELSLSRSVLTPGAYAPTYIYIIIKQHSSKLLFCRSFKFNFYNEMEMRVKYWRDICLFACVCE